MIETTGGCHGRLFPHYIALAGYCVIRDHVGGGGIGVSPQSPRLIASIEGQGDVSLLARFPPLIEE